MSLRTNHRARQVVRHCSRLLHYLNVAFVGLLVMVCVGLAGITLRLSNGPIDLTWIAALYGNNLQVTRGGVHLSFAHAALSWEGFQAGVDVPLGIRLSDVRVTDAEDRVLASANRAFASIAVSPLLVGRFVPRELELYNGTIAIMREYGSSSDASPTPDLTYPGEPEVPAPQPEPAPPRSFAEILRGSDMVGQLDHVRLLNFQLVLQGEEHAPRWRADIKSLDLRRQPNGEIGGMAHIPFVLDDRTADLDLHVTLPREGNGEISARLSAVDAAAVAQIFPSLSFLAAVQAPASSNVTVRLSHDLNVLGGSASILLDPGQIRFGKEILSISHGDLRVHGTAERVVIDAATLTLWTAKPQSATTISLQGVLHRSATRLNAAITAAVENLDVVDLSAYWPAEAAPGARAWVLQNVLSGTIPHATAKLVAESDHDLNDITVVKGTADADAHNVSIAWLDPIPPIDHAQVHLHLADPDHLIISMPTGRQRISNGGADLTIKDGQMDIYGLTVKDQNTTISLRTEGPVQSALTLLREPRLKLLSKHPIDLQEPSGTASVAVNLAFPLETKLEAEQIVFKVAAHLEQLKLARLVAGRNLTDGVIDLTADKSGLTLKGQASVASIPLSAEGMMDFNSGPASQVLQRITATGQPTVAQLAAAAIPVDNVLVSGDVPLSVTYSERRSGDGSIAINGDLTRAAMRVKAVGWEKAAGVPGKASATVALSHGRLKSIHDIAATSGDLDLAGSAECADGSVRSVMINRARFGRTDLRGSLQLAPNGPTDVSLSGPAIDLAAYLDGPSEHRGKRNNDVPDLTLKGRFDRVFLANGVIARGVSVQAATRNSHLWSLDGRGTLGQGGTVAATIGPSGGARRLAVDAADAGSLLRGLGLTNSVENGRLEIRGDYDDQSATHPLSGRAQVDNARLEDVPLLGKLLQAATLYGVADLLNGPGMGVSRIIVPFRYESELLHVDEARMFSSSLGLTAHGRVDMSAGRVAMTGTVVPAYALNSALGRIPFVGRIFSPETGGGLFAARYSVEGPFGDASVSVNPLSVLTPGFLRGLFDIGSAQQ